MKQYFKSLFSNHETEVLKSVFDEILDCKNKVSRDLRSGRMEVNQQQTNLDEIALNNKQIQGQSMQNKSKRLILQKQIQNLRRQQFQNDQAFKRAKQNIILKRQQQIRQQKQERQRKRREVQHRVKKWSQQQKQIIKKKQEKMLEEQKQRLQQEQRNKIKNQQEKKMTKIQKRKQIEQKLKEIQGNRVKREQLIKSMRSQSQDRLPLYMQFEKKAKKIQYQRNFQQNIQKKNHKLAMRMNYDALKQHQRQFILKIQQRNQKFQESRAKINSAMPDSQFSLYTNRSQDKVKEQLQKKQRRWKYQQKINAIPIQIDEAKKVKIQIAQDKSKNPFKYNFLSQKSLNQFQIYGEFKNFSINSNPRQIGIGYLQELKRIPKQSRIPQQSRIQKSNSLHIIKQTVNSDRPKYRNYLAQLKSKRPQSDSQKDQVKKILSNYKNKERAVRLLQRKSEQFEVHLSQKVKELKGLNTTDIKNVLRKESEIDQAYAKALKARLACLQISS